MKSMMRSSLAYLQHLQYVTVVKLRFCFFYVEDCSTKSRTTLWEISGDQKDAWKEACLQVQQGGHDFNLQIEAVRGPNYHSDIGLDDVEVKSGQCACHKRSRKSFHYQSYD